MNSRQSISSSEAYPASHGPSPASSKATPTRKAEIFGPISGDALAYFDPGPDGYSLKRSQGSLFPEDSTELCATLRKAGTMRAGVLFPLATPSAPPISASDCSSWPTATAKNFEGSEPEVFMARRARVKAKGINGNGFGLTLGMAVLVPPDWPTPRASPNENRQTKRTPSQEAGTHGKNLATEVHCWPTATAGDAKSSGSRNLADSKAHDGVSLTDAVKFGNSNTPRQGNWPTPQANDDKSGKGFDPTGRGHTPQLRHIVDGVLNGRWVEPLMGFPIGWCLLEGPSLANTDDPAAWPARPGEPQHDWEPARTCKSYKGRPAELRALGNAVVPAVVQLLGQAIIESEQ